MHFVSHETIQNKRRIAIFAGLILALDFVAYHSAIDYVGSGIATLIGNSQVIIVTLFSWKFLGERPNKSIILALPVVMIGLFFIGIPVSILVLYVLLRVRQYDERVDDSDSDNTIWW